MDSNFLKEQSRYEDIQKGIIAGNFSNADEILKSEEQVTFENQINKGEVEVISMDDIKETYNDRFFKSEDITSFEQKIEELIVKGETDVISEEELEFIEKGCSDIRNLEVKAIAVPKNSGHSYRKIYVEKQAETQE